MGYTLKAYIGKKENLNPILEKYSESQIVDLGYGISMIPMTEELFDQINNLEVSNSIDKFEFLTDYIERKTIEAIGLRQLAYVESEFFGGQGGHIGIIWGNGKRVYFGEHGKNTMNEIMKRLGINRTLMKDEFETVGLSKFRHTEDWIK